MGLYTNALMGTAMDERHTWTHAGQQRLEGAQERDEFEQVFAHCGSTSAIHEAGQPEQHALRLVPVRDLGVETLADFLVHPGTCEVCARTVAQNLGLGWPPEQAGVEVEDISDPEYVAKEQHEQAAAAMYDERYGLTDEERDEFEQEYGQGPAAPGAVHPNCRSATVQVDGEAVGEVENLEVRIRDAVERLAEDAVDRAVQDSPRQP